jgi:hypothetical protein
VHLSYRPVASNGDPTQDGHANHAKVAIVDDALLYVGSDNAYPSYNVEFGLWIGDEPSVQAFVNDYWTPLWNAVPIKSPGRP